MHDDTALRRILETCPTIAVVGAHSEPQRAAFYVPDYLEAFGYRNLPVNPALVGQTLWGRPVVATLVELEEPVDLVDIFRRGPAVAEHVPDILAMSPLPRVVWLQLGIRNDAAAAALARAGIDVVQDRCLLADHRRLGVGRVKGAAGARR